MWVVLPILFHFTCRYSRRVPACSWCSGRGVWPSSSHCNDTAPRPQPQDLLYQAVTAQPAGSRGGSEGCCCRHLSICMFCIFHLRSQELLGRSPSYMGRPEGGQPKGLGKLEDWQGQSRGSFTPQTWELDGMPQQHPQNIRAGADPVCVWLGWRGLQTAQCFCNPMSRRSCRLLSNDFPTC